MGGAGLHMSEGEMGIFGKNRLLGIRCEESSFLTFYVTYTEDLQLLIHRRIVAEYEKTIAQMIGEFT